MTIVFQCTCGRPLRASAEYVGKKTKCPGCGLILIIPAEDPKTSAATPVPAVVDDPFVVHLDSPAAETLRPDQPDPGRSSGAVIKLDTGYENVSSSEIARTEDGSKQYHVLGQKDLGFTKFNAAKLEEALNFHARQGWSLKTAVVINISGHSGNHDELVVILER
jgi:hypothetical protein